MLFIFIETEVKSLLAYEGIAKLHGAPELSSLASKSFKFWRAPSYTLIFVPMNRPSKARIIGTGCYLPERVLSNQDLEKMVDTSDEWIFTRTGMKERRIARDDEFTSDMGYEAALCAIEAAKISAEEIDLILVATLTPDFVFPSTACLLQARLKMVNAAAIDIQAACTGYIYALSQAKAYVNSGIYKNVLIVASEKLSSIIDYKDRNTCVLFGDGASACVVSCCGKGLVIRDVRLGADGELAELLILPAGGSRNPATSATVSAQLHYLRMEGKEVFKHAVRRMESAAKECLDSAGVAESEISWFIPHQANMRIIDAIAKRFDVPTDRVYLTIHKYGNTSASSIGIALDELLREKGVKHGENILLTAFGAGLTWGASVLTWSEETLNE
jgi:3-oxoacyl-[acyl-carrier-protein] synthase-3